MKNLMLVVSFFWILTLSLSAQNQVPAKTDSLIFAKTVHDYGTIKQGANGDCEFTFTNKGKEPIVLNNVRSSCGCTVPQWPREPILPGKSGSIKVTYDTKRMGPINKSVTVLSDAANSSVVLMITGNIVAQ